MAKPARNIQFHKATRVGRSREAECSRKCARRSQGNFASVRGVQAEVLEVRNLVKRYNRIPAVDQISFVIRPGEILGYLGPNGSGKSTTVKILTGLIDPTEGEILLDGRNVREDFVSFQRQMGYVPEESHLYPHLTGREYLQLVGRLRGLK